MQKNRFVSYYTGVTKLIKDSINYFNVSLNFCADCMDEQFCYPAWPLGWWFDTRYHLPKQSLENRRSICSYPALRFRDSAVGWSSTTQSTTQSSPSRHAHTLYVSWMTHPEIVKHEFLCPKLISSSICHKHAIGSLYCQWLVRVLLP